MQKRELLNTTAYYTGLGSTLRMYKKYFSNDLPILAYHRVLDAQSENFSSDIELVSSSPCNFEKQLDYICKHYMPISFSDLNSDGTYCGEKHKPPIILTFDDGFRDNYETVYPLLKKYKAKATFFIVTNVADRIEPLWFDFLAQQLLTCKSHSLKINDKTYNLGDNQEHRRSVLSELLLDLREISNQERLDVLNSVSESKEFINHKADYADYLSWDEIREMHIGGMEFGSHSKSHPILSQMHMREIITELCESKTRLEDELSDECISFSFPVGGFEEYNGDALVALKDCGYKFSCTYEPGLNNLPITDRYQLRRIHVERYTSEPTFKNVITSPFFGYK